MCHNFEIYFSPNSKLRFIRSLAKKRRNPPKRILLRECTDLPSSIKWPFFVCVKKFFIGATIYIDSKVSKDRMNSTFEMGRIKFTLGSGEKYDPNIVLLLGHLLVFREYIKQ